MSKGPYDAVNNCILLNYNAYLKVRHVGESFVKVLELAIVNLTAVSDVVTSRSLIFAAVCAQHLTTY